MHYGPASRPVRAPPLLALAALKGKVGEVARRSCAAAARLHVLQLFAAAYTGSSTSIKVICVEGAIKQHDQNCRVSPKACADSKYACPLTAWHHNLASRCCPLSSTLIYNQPLARATLPPMVRNRCMLQLVPLICPSSLPAALHLTHKQSPLPMNAQLHQPSSRATSPPPPCPCKLTPALTQHSRLPNRPSA